MSADADDRAPVITAHWAAPELLREFFPSVAEQKKRSKRARKAEKLRLHKEQQIASNKKSANDSLYEGLISDGAHKCNANKSLSDNAGKHILTQYDDEPSRLSNSALSSTTGAIHMLD